MHVGVSRRRDPNRIRELLDVDKKSRPPPKERPAGAGDEGV